jgi:multidrug resistance efflux pump
MIKGVTRGLVLLREEQGEGFLPVAAWPEGSGKLDNLGRAAQKALQAGQAVLLTTEEGQGDRPMIAHPLMTDGKAWGVVVVEVEARSEERSRGVMRGLQASSGWLRSLDPHRKAAIADEGDEGARLVLGSIAVLAEKRGFKSQALGLAIRLEKGLECERVSVGIMKKRRVTAQAVSTSPQFVQKTNLVRSIESAMEEACDQETTVQHPAPEDAPFVASIAHRAHARAYGHRSILSVPFDRNGEIVGAITLERPEGHPFTEQEVLAIEAVAALAGPQLDLSKKDERWIGAKVTESGKSALKALVGPRKRVVRLVLGALIAGSFFVCIKQTDYRVTSDAYLEPRQQLIVAAPIQGYVAEAPARAGDVVSRGDLLYATDETDLRLEVARLEGEREQARKRHLQAMAAGTPADVRILAAQLRQLQAQLDLADEQLSRARVLAPIDGVVVTGDLTQLIGSPMERGQAAYTIAPLDGFRVVLQVSDAEIDECVPGQEGVIVLTSMPGKEFGVRLDQVTPISISEEGMTYFRVEAKLLGEVPRDLFRPGMEGVGKVSVGERSLIWTWTHRAVDWFRLLWWRWTP